ncbi:carbonic anhydrase 6-like [Ictalurus punctatus]|uniref:Carbonic anhydrase 6-like n=1 Tax=Ictalurus punctatus TaxID=7998 RepID=A0A9F7RRF1_ICTPU|nr:carbonic anhydrase 6-like [Ictalurus punctatus]
MYPWLLPMTRQHMLFLVSSLKQPMTVANQRAGRTSPHSYQTFLKKGDLLDIMNQLTVDSLLEGVDRTKYYRYLGSLTTPACNEIVVWTVFKDPVKVSKDLIDLFSNTVHIDTTADPFINNNYRILQSLNGRVVTSQPTSSANTTSSASTHHHTLSISTALLYYVFFLVFVVPVYQDSSVIIRVFV